MKAIKHLKENTAPGGDEITREQLKALDEESLKSLTEVLNDIYNTGVVPNDFKNFLFIKIPKKSQRQLSVLSTTPLSCHKTIAKNHHG